MQCMKDSIETLKIGNKIKKWRERDSQLFARVYGPHTRYVASKLKPNRIRPNRYSATGTSKNNANFRCFYRRYIAI